MKSLLKGFILAFFLLSFLFVGKVNAQESLNAYLFYGEGCPHCAKEEEFLDKVQKNYPNLNLYKYEIYYNQSNNTLSQKVADELNVKVGGVPFLIIGDKSFIGYGEGITDRQIEERIKECTENKCHDSVAAIVEKTQNQDNKDKNQDESISGKKIQLPLIGEINIDKFSLPILTIVVGTLDGFNPCAMWTLLFLISLILGMKDRTRMWTLGIAFIAASAFVYFLFLSAWLNFFLFLGFIVWIRVIIGVVALFTGGYYLREFWINKSGSCKVTKNEKRQKVFERLRRIAQTPQFFLALGGIILLAAAVNMVELICSAGLPAIYTQILALSNLPIWQYYLYLVLYIFFFMLDDLIVFFIAMVTLRAVGIQTKYARYSHLIGGILMFAIGIILLLRPQWLMFG